MRVAYMDWQWRVHAMGEERDHFSNSIRSIEISLAGVTIFHSTSVVVHSVDQGENCYAPTCSSSLFSFYGPRYF